MVKPWANRKRDGETDRGEAGSAKKRKVLNNPDGQLLMLSLITRIMRDVYIEDKVFVSLSNVTLLNTDV